MHYLKKELYKTLPLGLLWGAIGGVLLITASNLFAASEFSILSIYCLVISASVYTLNHMRYKKEIKGAILYGYAVYV